MAGAVSNLMVRAGFDGSQLTRGLQQMQGEMRGAQSSIGSTLGTIGKITGAAVAAAGAALVAMGGYIAKVGVQYDALMEQSEIAWTTILGSANEAKDTIQKLQTMGAKTPFEFEGLDKSAKMLEMAGFKGQDLFNTLTKVGDAVSAVGGDDEVLNGVTLALFQMSTKGKISAQDMNQLAERGIPSWQLLADGMHKNVQEVMKLSEQGKLFAKDALPLMIDGMGNKFSGAMDKQSQTFNGMMSTLKDDFKMISAALAKPIFDGLKNGLSKLMPLFDGLTAWAQGKGLKSFDDAMKQTFGPEMSGFITTFVDNFKQGFSQIGSIMDKGKQAIQGLFDFFTGNKIEGISILEKLGLSPKLIGQIDTYTTGIKVNIQNFFGDISKFGQDLFSGKNSLSNSFISIFDTIKKIVMPILQDIVKFCGDEFSQIKKWWDTYGGQITEAVKNFFAVLAVIFRALAPILLFIIQSVWDNIKGIIDGAIKIIQGIILVFTGIFTGNWKTLWQGIKDILGGALEVIWNVINLMFIAKLLKGIGGFFTLIKDLFSGGWTSIVNGLKSFVSNAGDWFATFLDTAKTKFSAIVDAAKNIPSGIVKGLESGIKSVGDAIAGVANEIVKKFKEALGIHSPSKVFAEMGGHIISGLANGLTSGNLLDLGKAVFSDFGGGVLNTVDKIKGFLKGAFSGGASGSINGWLQSALAITGAPTSWLGPLNTLVQKESGGDPKAINLWDSNAKAGHPSKGLFQTIDSTFSAYAIKGLGDIYNPVANAVAGIRYIMDRYGSVFNVPGIKSMMSGGAYKGYASGTNSAIAGWHMVGEEGPELMYTPGGSVIKNNRDTNKMLGGTNKTYNVTVNSLQASMDEKDLVRALQRMEALNYV